MVTQHLSVRQSLVAASSPSVISVSTTTTTATVASAKPTAPFFWPIPHREGTRSISIIVPIVCGIVLLGIVIWVWRWRVLKKRRGYPGWRMMGMLGRSERRVERGGLGGAGARLGGVQETEVIARSSREELERITAAAAMTSQATTTTTSGSGAITAPVVRSIDAVVAGESVTSGKGTGAGNGGPARDA